MRLLVILLCCLASSTWAQERVFIDNFGADDDWNRNWLTMKGSFLEPNKFGIVYDNTPERLRLEVGYADEFMNISGFGVGGEILVWSGLKTLSGFRFPVETADYFFGMYSVFPFKVGWWKKPLSVRLRVSHISSHVVDGTLDTVIGGSSSKFSREFISLETGLDRYIKNGFVVTAGVKYIVHQVNKYEPIIQFPIAFDGKLYQFNAATCLFLFLSTAAGPSLPNYSAGLTFSHQYDRGRGIEIYGEYHAGHSRYGVDGDKKENGVEIGIRLCSLPYLYYW